MSSLPAGWYTDPADTSTQRYWDGEGWLGKAIPADAVPPDGPPPVEEEPAPVIETPVAKPAAESLPVPNPQGPPPGWQPPPGMRTAAFPYPVEARPHGFPLAGLGPRLVARLLDILAVLLLNVVVNGWFAYQWAQEFVPVYRAALESMEAGNSAFDGVQPNGRMEGLFWAMLIIATLLWLLYEAPAIASTGQTLGKRIMRIRVVALESTKPLGFGRAFGRWARLGLWTPFWYCGVGFIVQFVDAISPVFDPQLRQAFHDKTARTVVVAVPAGYVPAEPESTDLEENAEGRK
jgi:uncharacterized RDD family membrane protein YckC